MRAHHTWDHHERVQSQKGIAERLLTSADRAGPQPVGIRDDGGLDDMNHRRVRDLDLDQRVGHCVEDAEPLMNADFDDRRRRIDRATGAAAGALMVDMAKLSLNDPT